MAAGGTGCQVIAGLTAPVLRFAASYPSISTFSFTDDRHFLVIIPVYFRFFPDLICCRPTFEFKPIIILNCSSNMVAEGIRGQASGPVARRRRATLLVVNNSFHKPNAMLSCRARRSKQRKKEPPEAVHSCSQWHRSCWFHPVELHNLKMASAPLSRAT